MDNRTIIIENPLGTTRSDALLAHIYMLNTEEYQNLTKIPRKSNEIINIDEIKEVVTIKKVLNRVKDGIDDQLGVVVYGVITKFEIDPNYDHPFIKCCVICNRYLQKGSVACTNTVCIAELLSTASTSNFVEKFNILMWISDHTGTLVCRIKDDYAKTLLNYTVAEMKMLPDRTIEEIKDKYFLQRFAIKLVVKSKQQSEYVANVVEISSLNPSAMAAGLPTF